MKALTVFISALTLLAGCAAQEPVVIVEKGVQEPSCRNELAALRESSKAELAACHAARLEAEKRGKESEAAAQGLEQRLQEQQRQTEQAHKALGEKDAAVAACRGDVESLQAKAQADAEACKALHEQLRQEVKATQESAQQLQRMKDLEADLRQRLQAEIGAKDVEIERLRTQLSVRVLDRILFRSGSAEILPSGHKVLDAVAEALAGGNETIRIEGHADTVPIGPNLKHKYPTNWELSTGRASSVARHFAEAHAIEPTRMEAVGFSKYRPVASNDTPEERQRNRRVEIVLAPWKPVD